MDKSLIDNQRTNKLLCNCRNKEYFPIEGTLNSEKIVYQTIIFLVENCDEERDYIRIWAKIWKEVLQ